MKIKDNTYYNVYGNFIFYQLKNGSKICTRYAKNPSKRCTLVSGNSHLKSKSTVTRFFRVYNNFYIRLIKHNLTVSYHVI